MEYRPYYLAREWVRAGNSVRIVAADHSHVRAKQPICSARFNDTACAEDIDGVRYFWYPTSPYRGNGIGRVRNIAQFALGVIRDSRSIANQFKPHIVIASSTYPMDIWIARRIARLSGAVLVFEVHDLWPLSLTEVAGMSRHHPFVALCGIAERAAYRDSDVVISMLPKVSDYMASRGLDVAKLAIIPNGIALEDWSSPEATLNETLSNLIRSAKEQGRIVVGYAGSYGLPNALDVLLDAAKVLSSEPPVEIIMVGDGHEKHRLLRRISDEAIARVHMLPPIPKSQVPAFLGAIDIAYIGWQRRSIYRFGIAPNKLMDYMMAGCAVLHSVEAGNDPVAESGCGLTVAAESPGEVAAGIADLARLAPAERRMMGERGRQFVLAHHTYAVLADRFLRAVAERAPNG